METPTSSSAAALGASITSISELLNFSNSADLLDDGDFESTMMMFDHPESGGTLHSSSTRRLSVEPLDFSLTNLVDLFAHNDADAAALSNTGSSVKDDPLPLPAGCLSPDLKLRINGRMSFTNGQHPVAGNSSGPTIKQEPGAAIPELSPVMDSFLRESWEDIVDGAARSARSSWKMMQSPPTISVPLTNVPTRVTPLPHSFILPSPTAMVSLPPPPVLKAARSASKKKQTAPSTTVTTALAGQPVAAAAPKQASSKSSRRAKQCVAEGCDRRAQSNNRCKTHGGGARCQMQGCDKSSQGGGLCRAHGGGKKCRVPGCTKGTQRLGLCYLHGGIRRCITDGCKKKDRGNGYCISHGGGRRCEITGCDRSVRKGNRCQTHQVGGDESPFQITRGQGLAFP